jgi:hypothetical protein
MRLIKLLILFLFVILFQGCKSKKVKNSEYGSFIKNEKIVLCFLNSKPEIIDTMYLPNDFKYPLKKIEGYKSNMTLIKFDIYFINIFTSMQNANTILNNQLNDPVSDSLYGKLNKCNKVSHPFKDSIVTCYFFSESKQKTNNIISYYNKNKVVLLDDAYSANFKLYTDKVFEFDRKFLQNKVEVKYYERIKK